MGIDDLIRPDGVSVSGLVVPREQENDIIFDPLRDFTEGDWMSVREYLTYQVNEKNWGTVKDVVLPLLSVFPQRRKYFDSKDEFFGHIYPVVKENLGTDNWSYLSLSQLKLSFPDRELPLNDDLYDTLLSRREGSVAVRKWGSYATLTFALGVLFPEKRPDISTYPPAVEGLLEKSKTFCQQNSWFQAAEYSALLALLWPEQKSRLHLDREFWEKSKELMYKHFSESNFWSGSELLLWLSLLSADQAYIDENGILQVVPRQKPVDNQGQAVPEMRSF